MKIFFLCIFRIIIIITKGPNLITYDIIIPKEEKNLKLNFYLFAKYIYIIWTGLNTPFKC